MPTCQVCQREWTWKQTFIRQFRFNHRMTCPSCGESQYISAKTRKKMIGYVILIPFILMSLMAIIDVTVINISPGLLYLSEVCVFAILIFLLPFFIEITNTEEPLW
ncbi:TIGR04104 family putative zinc finger protein [Pseudalkalibacillus salsuginis]|uniref:TIGR04104 family putative zinc finger protein n=1 Tax=Pseudalkalibacillus salsuginis TaxID=2910972 RepID=UPI00389AB1E9